MYKTIIGLVPYGLNTHSDELGYYRYVNHKREVVHWHLIIWGKYINLGFDLPKKCQFTLALVDDCLSWTHYWGKPNTSDDGELALKYPEKYPDSVKYYNKHFWFPWRSTAFKHGVYYHDRWIDYPYYSNDYTLGDKSFKYIWDLAKLCEKKYSFNAYGKKIIASVHGKRIWYAPEWFPLWLKNLWHEKIEKLEMDFSDEIGEGRGSWKGGTVGMAAEWKGNIRDSWYAFKNGELKERIKDE